MSYISKHHREEKRKGHHSKYRWVQLLVSRHPICVNNFLKRPCKSIKVKIRWWLNVPNQFISLKYLNLNVPFTHPNIFFQLFKCLWTPKIPSYQLISFRAFNETVHFFMNCTFIVANQFVNMNS